MFESRVDLGQLRDAVTQIKLEIEKVVVGQPEMVELLITAILTDGHVLIEGVPGVAKTLTAKLMSKIISVDFARIQFTPDLMPSDVLGTSILEPELIKYIAEIVSQTRQHNAVFLGASPRASLAILNSARAFAAMRARDFVQPDDIKTVTYPVLRHRIILTPEKEMEGLGIDEVVKRIIQSVEVPR